MTINYFLIKRKKVEPVVSGATTKNRLAIIASGGNENGEIDEMDTVNTIRRMAIIAYLMDAESAINMDIRGKFILISTTALSERISNLLRAGGAEFRLLTEADYENIVKDKDWGSRYYKCDSWKTIVMKWGDDPTRYIYPSSIPPTTIFTLRKESIRNYACDIRNDIDNKDWYLPPEALSNAYRCYENIHWFDDDSFTTGVYTYTKDDILSILNIFINADVNDSLNEVISMNILGTIGKSLGSMRSFFNNPELRDDERLKFFARAIILDYEVVYVPPVNYPWMFQQNVVPKPAYEFLQEWAKAKRIFHIKDDSSKDTSDNMEDDSVLKVVGVNIPAMNYSTKRLLEDLCAEDLNELVISHIMTKEGVFISLENPQALLFIDVANNDERYNYRYFRNTIDIEYDNGVKKYMHAVLSGAVNKKNSEISILNSNTGIATLYFANKESLDRYRTYSATNRGEGIKQTAVIGYDTDASEYARSIATKENAFSSDPFIAVRKRNNDGLRKEDFTAASNSVVQGAYPKAVGTADSGYYSSRKTMIPEALIDRSIGTNCTENPSSESKSDNESRDTLGEIATRIQQQKKLKIYGVALPTFSISVDKILESLGTSGIGNLCVSHIKAGEKIIALAKPINLTGIVTADVKTGTITETNYCFSAPIEEEVSIDTDSEPIKVSSYVSGVITKGILSVTASNFGVIGEIYFSNIDDLNAGDGTLDVNN